MQQSLKTLRRLSPLSPTATRCLAALEILEDEILSDDVSDLPVLTNPTLVQDPSSEVTQDLDLPTRIMPPPPPQSISFPASQQQYLPQEQDLQSGDALGAVPDLLDFTWLESSAADLLGGGYED